jgi:hypothetical protein
MSRFNISVSAVVMAALAICAAPASADEVDPCAHFTWNVSHETGVMKQTPQSVKAAVTPGSKSPLLQVEKLYELKLTGQEAVTYAVTPAKPAHADKPQGGMARFQVPKAGVYRISISSGHWIDVLDGTQFVKSRDFQASHGCARPRKIVEFDLPGGRDLILQLSGFPDATVMVAITAVS